MRGVVGMEGERRVGTRAGCCGGGRIWHGGGPARGLECLGATGVWGRTGLLEQEVMRAVYGFSVEFDGAGVEGIVEWRWLLEVGTFINGF